MTNKGADNVTQPNEQLVAHIVEMHGYAIEYKVKRIDLSIEELSALLEENKRIAELHKKATEYCAQGLLDNAELESQLQQTREELAAVIREQEYAKSQAIQWNDKAVALREELEQVKAERDTILNDSIRECARLAGENESIHTELEAKDKVLTEIANYPKGNALVYVNEIKGIAQKLFHPIPQGRREQRNEH